MGCDIHVYVEFSKDGRHWRNLTDNAGSRDYWLFGVLADVRGGPAVYPPKGMPKGSLGYITESGYWTNVAPDSHPEWAETGGWVARETAENWVSNGYSIGDRDEKGALKRVSGPDWHNHSWLTASELSKCLDEYERRHGQKPPTEWVAILAAMKAVEDCGEQTRVIFWFDN